jgi:hypothetical protein
MTHTRQHSFTPGACVFQPPAKHSPPEEFFKYPRAQAEEDGIEDQCSLRRKIHQWSFAENPGHRGIEGDVPDLRKDEGGSANQQQPPSEFPFSGQDDRHSDGYGNHQYTVQKVKNE